MKKAAFEWAGCVTFVASEDMNCNAFCMLYK